MAENIGGSTVRGGCQQHHVDGELSWQLEQNVDTKTNRGQYKSLNEKSQQYCFGIAHDAAEISDSETQAEPEHDHAEGNG